MPVWIHDDTVKVINELPNPFGTFEKAKYRVYGYSDTILYSCVTSCRSEEEMVNMLADRCRGMFKMKESNFAKITKIQNGKEKVLLKGNVYKNGNKE